jgi:hypothetical protein
VPGTCPGPQHEEDGMEEELKLLIPIIAIVLGIGVAAWAIY